MLAIITQNPSLYTSQAQRTAINYQSTLQSNYRIWYIKIQTTIYYSISAINHHATTQSRTKITKRKQQNESKQNSEKQTHLNLLHSPGLLKQRSQLTAIDLKRQIPDKDLQIGREALLPHLGAVQILQVRRERDVPHKAGSEVRAAAEGRNPEHELGQDFAGRRREEERRSGSSGGGGAGVVEGEGSRG